MPEDGTPQAQIPPSQTKAEPIQTRPNQENGLGSFWIPSSDLGLFNGLRAIQVTGANFRAREGSYGLESMILNPAVEA
jgi:hypothetical protein